MSFDRLDEIICAVAKRTRIPFLQRAAWNREFRGGSWNDRLQGCPVALELILSHVPSGSSIVDLGCGNGVMGRHVFARGWTGKYVGIDLSGAAIEAARLACPQAEWRVGGITDKLGFSPDALLMLESVYYIPVTAARTVIESFAAKFVLCRVHDPQKYLAYVDMLLNLGFQKVAAGKTQLVLYR